jgi:hypothetical protein
MRLSLLNSYWGKVDLDFETSGLTLQHSEPFRWEFAKSAKTWEIFIPKTQKNTKYLSNFFWQNHNHVKMFPAELQIQSIPIQGTVWLSKWDDRGLWGQFVGTFGEWTLQRGNLNLRDLDWSDLQHTLNSSVLATNWLNNKIIYDRAYRGRARKMGSGLTLSEIDIAEMAGAVSVKTIIDRIFQGWEIQYEIYPPGQSDRIDKLYNIFGGVRNNNTPGWIKENQVESNTVDFIPSSETKNNVQDSDLVEFRLKNWVPKNVKGIQPVLNDGYWEWEVPEAGTWGMEVGFRPEINIQTVSLPPSGPIVSTWSNISLDWVIERRIPFGTWNQWARKTVFSGQSLPGAETQIYIGPETIAQWSTPESRGPLWSTWTDCPAGTKWRAYASWKWVATNGETHNQIINAGANPPGNDNINFVWLGGHIGLGAGKTVPGNWWIPDMTVNEFLKNFLMLFSAECMINNELRKVRFINRNQGPRALYDWTKLVRRETLTAEFWENLGVSWNWANPGKNDWSSKNLTPDEKVIGDGSTNIRVAWQQPPLRGNKIFMERESNDSYNWSLDFPHSLAYFGGWVNENWTLWRRNSITDLKETRTQVPNWTTQMAGLTLKWDGDLYTKYHDISRYQNGKRVKFQLELPPGKISNIYFMSGEDLGANYIINIPGYEGVYQIIKLDHVRDNIWSAEGVEVSVWK